MALSRINSVSLLGLEALPVEVEVDAFSGGEAKTLLIVGLPDAAVKESKERVLAAIKNTQKHFDSFHAVVNLAPGDLRKEGAMYDLPIAIGVIQSLKIAQNLQSLEDYLVVGELGLGGELRPVRGALSIAMLARKMKKKGILIPAQNAEEAAAVPEISVIPIRHLNDAIQFLQQPESISPISREMTDSLFTKAEALIDFADIRGQAHVKRAMEIAAAGSHNVALCGPPGSGKTMVAKALVGIMPELTVNEALEVTKIHSVAGMLPEGESLVRQRPFRAPHHTVSYAGLIGGGSVPRPGEVSLAHFGILFLDELPEFSRQVLEVLRQPLEDRHVTISRANGNFTYPTNFICIAAMNPCPCGFRGHPDKPCKDTDTQVDRYRGKISGPIWDRIDIHIDVPPVKYQEIMEGGSAESSESVRSRVKKARDLQKRRFGSERTNSLMSSKEIKSHVSLTPDCVQTLRQSMDRMGFSARACDRILRVTRTIADLDGSDEVRREHLMEAIGYRTQV